MQENTSTHQDPQWTLGDRLRKSREDAGYDQEQMAALMDVSASTISAWERDESQPRKISAVLTDWSRHTGVRTGWLSEGIAATPRSRCASVVDLRILPGGSKDPTKISQPTLPFLTLCTDN